MLGEISGRFTFASYFGMELGVLFFFLLVFASGVDTCSASPGRLALGLEAVTGVLQYSQCRTTFGTEA